MNPPAERPSPDGVHKIVDWAIGKERDVITSKFNAVDTRINSLSAELERLPAQIERMMKSLSDVIGGQHANIMAEVMSVKKTTDNVETVTKTLDDKTDSLRDRLTIMEAKTIASHTTRADSSAKTLSWFAILTTIAIGAGTIWTGVQHNDSDKMLYENVNRLQTDHDHLARTTARNPVEKGDVDLLSSRLDALSRRLNTMPSVGSTTPNCPGTSC